MDISLAELKQAEASLRQWMSPDEFSRRSETYRARVIPGTLFHQPGYQFLFEAWTACHFINLVPCDAVRLFDGNWPDFQTRQRDIIKGYEVAEVIDPNRRRGAENWNAESVIPDPEEDWHKRAALILPTLRAVIAKKVGKHYPANEAALLLYLNIDEWGVRQRELEADFHAATQLAKDKFTDVWLLWKVRLYHLWQNGEKATGVFQRQLSVEDY